MTNKRTARALTMAAAVALLFASQPLAQPQSQKAAYFGFVFVNTSPTPTSAEERERLAMIEERLRKALSDSGAYEFLDTAPVAKEVDRYANIADCNGCEAGLAGKLGAEVSITGVVQKVSNLILSINIYIRDAESRNLVGGGSTDIRGNTDQSWRRGVDWLVKNRLLRGRKPAE